MNFTSCNYLLDNDLYNLINKKFNNSSYINTNLEIGKKIKDR